MCIASCILQSGTCQERTSQSVVNVLTSDMDAGSDNDFGTAALKNMDKAVEKLEQLESLIYAVTLRASPDQALVSQHLKSKSVIQ